MRLEDYFEWRRLVPDAPLASFLAEMPPPAGSPIEAVLNTVDPGDLEMLHDSLPANFVPLVLLDDASVACIAGTPVEDQPAGTGGGLVLRYFLNAGPPLEQQARVLDINARFFLHSWDQELAARDEGLRRMYDEIGPEYDQTHLARERRPRDYVVRPVRLACQNVVVGLAAIAQDSSIDGLSVVAWQTAEVPHVATHEANRALAALTLCDAYQNGGTMEIRFDRKVRLRVKGKEKTYEGHPEGRVPASLRRYGRSVGVLLGAEDRAAISPTEARELFLAVTPMPHQLRRRVERAVSRQAISPERLCYSLLSQVWREIELDLILGLSPRAASILEGGASWTDRLARQAESEVCRSAIMAGMLYRRLNGTDAASPGSDARVVEDRKRGVTWSVDEEHGAIRFDGLSQDDSLPWGGKGHHDRIVAAFRTQVDSDQLNALAASDDATHLAVVVPSDAPTVGVPDGVSLLRCPDRLADIDKSIEERLLKSRISRS